MFVSKLGGIFSDIMQQKSDNYVEGNGIGPPTGYNNIDHQLQNQGNFQSPIFRIPSILAILIV